MKTIDNLRHREFEQTKEFIFDKMSALRSIEMNITEMCNRSCSFCPHGIESYKNSKTPDMKFPTELAEILNKNLQEINYTGQLSFTGMGEPLVNKELPTLIAIVTKDIKPRFVEINTNGDALTKKNAKKLVEAGATQLTISLYDGNTEKHFLNELKDIDAEIVFKHWYEREEDDEMWVNRNEMVYNPKELNVSKTCYFPFSRIFLDWNGNILLCANDWKRETNMGNLYNSSLKSIWTGPLFTEYRKMLMDNKRNLSPCSNCSMNGTVTGKPSYEYFKNDSI